MDTVNIHSLLWQQVPEVHCLISKELFSFTFFNLISSRFTWVFPSPCSVGSGEQQFGIQHGQHLCDIMSRYQYCVVQYPSILSSESSRVPISYNLFS